MDFGALPPEINSGRMYVGPGAESMVAAASAWDMLAAQLGSTAASYSSLISGLTADWQGPSSTAMAAATAPYATWMRAAAAQAEQAAAQARAAVAGYETAFAATVPPLVIAANRSQLALLVTTNLFGQNTPAIAATEAQYGDMWAQDTAAMYGYAGSSATAAQMTPFTPPPATTNPGGLAGQAAAVTQATGTAPTSAQSALSQLMSAMPQALQSLATPAAADSQTLAEKLTALLSALNSSGLAKLAASVEFVTKGLRPFNDTALSISMGLVATARATNDEAVALEGPLFAELGSGTQALGAAGLTAGGPAVSAGVGSAGLVGALSVPPSWATATPVVRLAATALQGTSAAAALAAAGSAASLSGQVALASFAGSALGGIVPRAITGTTARGEGRPTSEKDSKTSEKLKRVLADLSQKPESVQHWHTDKANLEGLLDQLSKKPGVHAVHLSSTNKSKPTPPGARWG